jgi:beta-N-acetylhexosaminidase
VRGPHRRGAEARRRSTPIVALVALATAAAPLAAAPPASAADPAGCVRALPEDVFAGQLLIAGSDRPADALDLLDRGLVAGVLPFTSLDAEGARGLAALAASQPRYGALIASDEEGGRVQNLRNELGAIPSAAELARTMSPAEVEQLFAGYGLKLRLAGVGVALAPDVDVGAGPAIGTRSFSDDPAVVATYAAAVVAGYQEAGVLPVLKHFPGHGHASANTHDGSAVVPPIDQLRQDDLVPFKLLLAAQGDHVAVMVGHLEVPDLTDGLPASLSPAAIDGVLRKELGFDGLVISDALRMGAISQSFSAGDATLRFLAAGGDLAMVSLADAEDVRHQVVVALATGRLDRDQAVASVVRVFKAKGIDPCTLVAPPPSTTAATAPPPSSAAPTTVAAAVPTAPPTSPAAVSSAAPGSSGAPSEAAAEPAGDDRRPLALVAVGALGVAVAAGAGVLFVRRGRPAG